MTVEINQMINIIEDFMEREDLYSLDIGGCIGSGIFRICINTVTHYLDFTNILVVEGCQDFVEMMKERIPNHIFYAEAISTMWDDPFVKDSYETPDFMKHDLVYTTAPLNFNRYPLMVINDAHLIDSTILQKIRDNFYGKIIMICDPLDYGGDKWLHVPYVIDSLTRLSVIQAYARSLYEIETRAIDKNIICRFKDAGTVSIRSIGKQDKNQYVTPCEDVIKLVNERRKPELKRGQKIVCKNRYINSYTGEDGCSHIFTNHSMGTLISNKQLINCMYNVKLHNSRHDIVCDLTMDINNTKHYDTYVEPANIIPIEEMRHHKFNSIVLVLPEYETIGDEAPKYRGLTRREFYSVLRSTTDLTIGHLKMKG